MRPQTRSRHALPTIRSSPGSPLLFTAPHPPQREDRPLPCAVVDSTAHTTVDRSRLGCLRGVGINCSPGVVQWVSDRFPDVCDVCLRPPFLAPSRALKNRPLSRFMGVGATLCFMRAIATRPSVLERGVEPYTDASPPLPSSRLPAPPSRRRRRRRRSARRHPHLVAAPRPSPAASLATPAEPGVSTSSCTTARARWIARISVSDRTVSSARVGQLAQAVSRWAKMVFARLHNHGERCGACVLRLTTPTRAAGAGPHPLSVSCLYKCDVGNADESAPVAGLL